MTPLEALDTAAAAYESRLLAVRPDQWGLPTPCEQWTVKDLADHVLGGNRFSLPLLTGGSAAEAIGVARSGDFSGDPVESYRQSVAAQHEAFAAPGALPRPGHVVQQPCELGPGEVGVQEQPGLVDEQGLVPRLSQSVTSRRSASVLPHDGMRHWATRKAVPEDRGLPLVGDAHRDDVARAQPGGGERLGGHIALRTPDFVRVVLHPARLGEDLAKFLLCSRYHAAVTPKSDGSRAGGALIEGENGLHGVQIGRLPLVFAAIIR